MPTSTFNLEWLDHNTERAYPLAIEATRQDATGSFTLPDDTIVSLYLSVHAGMDVQPGRFFLRSINNLPSGLAIVIAYNSSSGVIDVASGLVARAAYQKYQAYSLGGIGDFADARGHFVLGDLANLDNQPAGEFEFEFEGGRLEADCIRPMIRGVTGLRVSSGGDLSEPIYGNIVLQAGNNIRLTPLNDGGQDGTIVIDAIEGEGLTQTCVCADTIGDPIRTIAGVGPDSNGNINLLGDGCLKITGLNGGIQLSDECSAPCCGCEELEIVTQAAEQFGDKATTLEGFINQLAASVNQMDQVVLGSRLGDRGCNTCGS